MRTTSTAARCAGGRHDHIDNEERVVDERTADDAGYGPRLGVRWTWAGLLSIA
jgi:hypothetical protein